MDIVVTRESIRTKAQLDYKRNLRLDQCPFWPTSEAAKTWCEEWRRLDTERRMKLAAA